ncbi:MAG: hypothetical protein ACO3JL_05020, partial [Myxococcota bacterium]
PSFDHAVAQEHLKDAEGLPVVWLYDERGTRIDVFAAASVAKIRERLEKKLRTTHDPAITTE